MYIISILFEVLVYSHDNASMVICLIVIASVSGPSAKWLNNEEPVVIEGTILLSLSCFLIDLPTLVPTHVKLIFEVGLFIFIIYNEYSSTLPSVLFNLGLLHG